MSSASASEPPGATPSQPAVGERGASAAHAAGEILGGKYRLDQLLGQGGMGSVWRARSLVLEIDVAVKVVPRDTGASDTSARLLREARAAASLGHPSIVRVFDFGTTEQGEPFLVMELLAGGSLGSLLDERARLPAAMAVRLMLPVVSALASAHARGIVHRDIKPDNIMLVPATLGDAAGDGDMLVPKLVDFGIVKLQEGVDVATLTDRGTLIGSPEYMSPEQARGLVDVDARTDIWSVCVVLYELITGERPFRGPNHGAVLYAIFSAEPEPSVGRSAGDEALWEILARGLEKAPADRWPDAKALGRELAGWAAGHGITTDAAGMSIADQWLGRASSVDLGREPAPPRSRRSSTDVVTARLSPSVTDEPPEPPDRSRLRRARDVALGVALAAVLVVAAFSAPRNHGAAGPAAGARLPAALPTVEPQAAPIPEGAGRLDAPSAAVSASASAAPEPPAAARSKIRGNAAPPRPSNAGHPSPARTTRAAALPPPDF